MKVAAPTIAVPTTREPRRLLLRPSQALALPSLFTVMLGALAATPPARSNPSLFWSILGAAAALSVGLVALSARTHRRTLTLEILPRAQHYLQACAQCTVLLY